MRGRRYLRDPGERRLTEVLERVELAGAADARGPDPALRRALHHEGAAKAMRVPLPLAQKAAHCLRALGLFEPAGMRGRAPLHQTVSR